MFFHISQSIDFIEFFNFLKSELLTKTEICRALKRIEWSRDLQLTYQWLR